jgi:RNA recognition motif-containing protein
MRIYVGNLPYTYDDQQLATLFQSHGEIASARIVLDRESGRSRGFGFIEMPDEGAARSAMDAMNGKPIDGRPLVVNEARPSAAHTGGGGPRPPRESSPPRPQRDGGGYSGGGGFSSGPRPSRGERPGGGERGGERGGGDRGGKRSSRSSDSDRRPSRGRNHDDSSSGDWGGNRGGGRRRGGDDQSWED